MLAIPHNGNLSNGRMFAVETFDGKPLTKEWAAMRARFEPLIEATQIKGDGEAHPFLSPNDEFADYEKWDKSNLNGTEAKKPEMLQYEYAREALKNGLLLERKLGVNPFKFGMVGSTDAHTVMTAVEEDNFFGKHSGVEPGPHRWEHVVIEAPDPKFTIKGWQQAAAGYAGVWATENTREAIFDAMKRKETYATTGPRMMVRFFGGWDFTADDAQSRLPAGVGYAKGVPMGGDLRKAPGGKSPTFLVAAMKDSYSGNLDRIQIVKGWLDKDGKTHEKVYDVVWSGDRKPGADGKLPPVGNTVDVAKATWKNTIGAPELSATWTDPEFDATQPAFYYARVIEIPTPRWTAYEALRFGIKMPPEVPMTTQERAYTSPIWYSPGRIAETMKKFLREPLLHFLLLGAAIFVAYGLLSKRRSEAPGKDRHHAGTDRASCRRLREDLAAAAHRRGTGGPDPRPRARGSLLPRGDGARAWTRTTPSSAAGCGRRWSSSPTTSPPRPSRPTPT